MDDVTVNEGDSGTTNARFTISLSAASGKTASVDYGTQDGSANAPGDYTETSGTLTFSPGATSRAINVPVNGDTVDEDDETFAMMLDLPQNATLGDAQGDATVTDDDTPNAVPTADDDSYQTRQDTTLRVPAPGLLDGDQDSDGDTLTAVDAGYAAHGEVTVRRDGSFVYYPDAGFVGGDSFTYRASDGKTSSEAATVQITVTDAIAPTITKVSPRDGSRRVTAGSNVEVGFSEAMDASTIDGTTFKLRKKGTSRSIPASITYDAANNRAILNPDAKLKPGTTYIAKVTSGAEDLAGNALATKTWRFKVIG